LGQDATFVLEGRLPERPLEPLWSELNRSGAVLEKSCREEISVRGKLRANEFTVAADVSSQYISGLLFALPLLGGGKIHLTGKVESKGYITMTCEALMSFGVECLWENDTITVWGEYRSPKELCVEGDWSNAAFWLAADTLSSKKVLCTGLQDSSSQGDKEVVSALAKISRGNAVIDASQIPDLVPILAVVAALTEGKTEFVNAGRLRLKESDRLLAMEQMLTELGGKATQTEDRLIVWGRSSLAGGITHSRNDHRIAMSAAIASLGCRGAVTIQNAEAVEKSYPDFWNDFARLGGKLEEVTP
jgi:3-phosphoshikimate 1-carboxyvinyltransferase